jgi:hypothetical protein
MLKRVMLLTVVMLSMAYSRRPVGVAQIAPLPECPPFCDSSR